MPARSCRRRAPGSSPSSATACWCTRSDLDGRRRIRSSGIPCGEAIAPPPPLLACEAVRKQFGARPLFTGISLAVAAGDRIGLVGPNGAGKSTLLRILAGIEVADEGTRALRKGARVAFVAQDPALPPGETVGTTVLGALAAAGVEESVRHGRAARALGRFGFDDFERPAEELSGGWKKRLAIAREIALEPDLLILDEPTNHLDLEGILELEEILSSSASACLVASHDRYFLERIATRMLEIDPAYPNGYLTVEGSYSTLLERRDEVRRNQLEYQGTLANRARREVEWLRRGPKARTTKSKARIDEAHRLLDELAEVRTRNAGGAPAGIDFEGTGRKTRRLLVARGLGASYGERRVLDGIELELGPGVRLGVLGANGSGKTTLLSLLAGTAAPREGTIDRAAGLRTVYFEQSRASLDPGIPLRRALAPDSDSVVHLDQAVHVAAWARRFLFRGEQLDTPVGSLSGGEQARILIARLMLQPADLLILDEPTNDLDIPTLEVLEESLLEFPGAVVLVTHDRYLLDRVSTAILALDGRGRATAFAELAQWELARRAARRETPAARSTRRDEPESAPSRPRKRSYLEQREWDGMEAAIEAAERELERCRAAVEDPAIAADAALVAARYDELGIAAATVDRLYSRWAELEGGGS